tara:strand:+ start:147 stop:320 length:174 start_codon:yes stop_codon:yes gene_type:complete
MNNELKNNMDRVKYQNDLYEKSGRSDPSHPYYCLFTNLHIEEEQRKKAATAFPFIAC